MNITYSTVGLLEAQRFAQWHATLCRHCLPGDSRRVSREPFESRLEVRRLGAVDVFSMSAPRHEWLRNESHVQAHASDDLWVGFAQEGEGAIEQEGRRVILKPGDMVLYDAARPFTSVVETRKAYAIRMPRRSLLQRFAGAERAIARVIAPSQPGAPALREMLLQAATLELPERSRVANRFGAMLIDLLAATLEMQHGTARDEVPRRDLHTRILDYILAHFEDPSMSLESLARAHHVSVRTVTRAFAGREESAMSLVLRLRLEASRCALVEGRASSVTEAAFRSGFSDLSHFSRVFRKAYGCTPRTLVATNGPD